MTLLVGSIFHMTRKIVSEMTYNVSSGTLNSTNSTQLNLYLYHMISSLDGHCHLRHKRECRSFPQQSNGGRRKDEGSVMSSALVGDSKDIRPQKLCINYPSRNVLSFHSSSFTTIPSPVWEGHHGMMDKESRMKLANQVYLKGWLCVCMCVIFSCA